jgi:hypothetical protein
MLAVTNLIGFGARRLVAPVASPVVWNSLDKTASVTLSNGDKTATASANNQGARGNIGKSSGKWYFEIVQGSTPWQNAGADNAFGIALTTFVTLGSTDVGFAAGSAGVANSFNTYRLNGGSFVTADPHPGAGNSAGSVFMIAVDLDAGYVWFGVNGTWGGVGGVTGVPATGTAPSLSGLSGTYYPCASVSDNGGIAHIYASLADCTYAPPSGFSYWSA